MRLPILSIIVLSLSTSLAQTPELNIRIVDYALSKMDQKVGKGVCWELVYGALQHTGAKLGDTICFDDVRPGDIVYNSSVMGFINGYTAGEALSERIAKGRDSVPNLEVASIECHIAIVRKTNEDGTFEVFEQNAAKNQRLSRVVSNKRSMYLTEVDSILLPIVYFDQHFIRSVEGLQEADLVQFGNNYSRLDKALMSFDGWVNKIYRRSPFVKYYDVSAPVEFPGDELFDWLKDMMLADKCWVPSDLVYNLYYKDFFEKRTEESVLDSLILGDDFTLKADQLKPTDQ